MVELIEDLSKMLADPAVRHALAVFSVTLLAYWFFSAAVGAMEMPGPNDSRAYRYWFRLLNRFAGNLDRAARALHLPGEVKGDPTDLTEKPRI